jgi:circadian clock protein KaiC
LEDWLVNIQTTIEEFKPKRVALDSLSALERMGSLKAFREFVIGFTSFLKQKEVAGLLTSTTPTLMGGASITEGHISTLTDSIILLRYVEMYGEMKRGLTVLKMRGSVHDRSIREFNIDAEGLHLGRRFGNVTGILGGAPMHVSPADVERAWTQYDTDADRERRKSH